MTLKATLRRSLFAIALLLLVPAACADDPTALIDALDITNQTDLYTFELDNPGTYSGQTRHQWTFTGTIAELEVISPITGGSGSVTVQDADNAQVIVRSLLTPGTVEGTTGRAGTWIVTTILTNAVGHLEYRLTKK